MILRNKQATASAVALCATLAVGGCASAPAHGQGLSGPGPLRGQEQKTAYVVPADTPDVFTDGFAIIDLPVEKPAEIIKVESIGGSEALEFLGAKIAKPERDFVSQQIMPEWPPKMFSPTEMGDPGKLQVQATSKSFNELGYQILMGYRIKSHVAAVRTGIRVTYKISGKTYQAVLPSAFAICGNGENNDKCLDHAFAVAGQQLE